MNGDSETTPDGAQDGRVAVVLASASPARAELLERAGVPFETVPARIDEDEIKTALTAEGATGTDIAVALAVHKAQYVSRQRPGRLVIGADQVLEFDGRCFSKPADRAAAREQLVALGGQPHDQISCACVVRDDQRLWHEVSRTRLFMRPLGEEFIEHYLDTIGDAALAGPGAYQIEGLGVQLFSRIDGDYFTVLGLPLIPLLDYLRLQEVLST